MPKIEIKRQGFKPTVVLLSAGIGTRIRSHEPRSLIAYKGTTLVEHQIKTIENSFNGCDIIVVCGHDSHKVNKKLEKYKNVRIVENELYKETGSASSLRLAINNTRNDKILMIHGDIIFNIQTLDKNDYSRSFMLVDRKKMMNEREVGVILHENETAENISFGLPDQPRWCQIAYLTGDELIRMRKIVNKSSEWNKKQLTFELLNEIIDAGGAFKCYEPQHMKVFELDSMREFIEAKVNI